MTTRIACPQCQRNLAELEWRGVCVRLCKRCRGAFLEFPDLQRLAELTRGESAGEASPLFGQKERGHKPRFLCPRCGEIMREHPEWYSFKK